MNIENISVLVSSNFVFPFKLISVLFKKVNFVLNMLGS